MKLKGYYHCKSNFFDTYQKKKKSLEKPNENWENITHGTWSDCFVENNPKS